MNKKFLVYSIILLSLITIIAYTVIRVVLLYYAEYNGIDRVMSILLVFGEFFIIFHGVGYTLNIFRSYRYKRDNANLLKNIPSLSQEPSIAILVAARHEPKDILENTFLCIKNMKYDNKTIYLLDDSSDEKYKKESDELAKDLGLNVFRRQSRHGAKAGIVNDCLKTLSEKYIVIFDADQNPLPEFLNKIVPIMESNNKLAFIQTPQFYTNADESRVARAASFQQAVFYEYICEGKSTQGAMFCCGTNIIFRKEALVDVGGLDESTVTEDFATSLKLHQKKWKSLYYNHTYAFGMAPLNLSGYLKQQYRWANGTISVLKKVLWSLVRRPFSLSLSQWLEYFLSGSYYIVGLAFFILMLFPVLYLLFRVPSFFAKPEVYIMAFLPYILLSTSVFYFILKERNYRVKDLFLGQILGAVTFSVYVRAAISSFLGIKTVFGITEKKKNTIIPYMYLWPQLLFIFLNYIAIVWGVNRFFVERNPAILINCFWAAYHFSILSTIFYFNSDKA